VLNDFERRTLSEIERRITAGDPGLAAALTRDGSDRRSRWTQRAYTVVGLVAAVAAVLCLALSGTGSGGAGLVAGLFAVLVFAVRRRRFPNHNPSSSSRQAWPRR
jgi:peptidoglycan/LPS O-acetylase OafA/YrhL